MLSASNSQGTIVFSNTVQRESGPFYCRGYLQPVTLKRGHIRLAHFAHQPGSDCSYAGTGESEEHRKAKWEIYNALLTTPSVTNVQLEQNLQEVRPDVSFVYKDTFVTVEVQISNLSPDDIEHRTRAYVSKNIAVLWTPPLSLEVLEERYAPCHWERYIHILYYKTIYYWFRGLNVHPVRYNDHWLATSRYFEARRCSMARGIDGASTPFSPCTSVDAEI